MPFHRWPQSEEDFCSERSRFFDVKLSVNFRRELATESSENDAEFFRRPVTGVARCAHELLRNGDIDR